GARTVIAVDLDGKSEIVVRVPTVRGSGLDPVTSGPYSIDWLPDGRLLVVSGRDRLLLRREPDGSLVTHANLAGLCDHPWNEIVVDGRGNAYLDSIGFDFPGGPIAPGVLGLVTAGGSVRRVADGLGFPNGLVVTPDDSTLIVAE
ncbi:MAG: SMP-30/gluconolactonase/LRE family protein, partial [Candidatus Eisenbacteria bacterium]